MAKVPPFPAPRCCPFCAFEGVIREKHSYAVEGGAWDEQREESEFEFAGVGFNCLNPDCKAFFLVER